MTISVNAVIDEWSAHPLGRVTRIAIGLVGLGSAILLLLIATLVESSTWPLVIAGVGMAGLTVRAVERPTIVRLSTLLVFVLVAPYLTQIV
ncbi:MAG: hypothetical protein WA726_03820 [Acidimicrobiia bacterium]